MEQRHASGSAEAFGVKLLNLATKYRSQVSKYSRDMQGGPTQQRPDDDDAQIKPL